MGRLSSKSCRLISMMVLTSGFFIAEITTGYITDSMALVADSFHMLSDIVSLIVGFVAIKVSKLSTSRNTYGWVRAEIVGALVNGVFLVALCFTIVVEALQRFIENEIEVKNPQLVLAVGSAGLVVNLLGLCLFSSHGHGHSHGGGDHGHSHGESEGIKRTSESTKRLLNKEDNSAVVKGGSDVENGLVDQTDVVLEGSHKNDYDSDDIEATVASSAQLNMRGVFLHVLGDALGSVVVIISALIIWFAEGEWRFYVDPAMSIGICVIILSTSVPLLKQSAMILMQSLPSHIDVEHIKEQLEQEFPSISVHDFHVWQLTTNLMIATTHIVVSGDVADYMAMAESLKVFFHKQGIHSTTIQPEFLLDSTDCAITEANCVLECKTDVCGKQRCCSTKPKEPKTHDVKNVSAPSQEENIAMVTNDSENIDAKV